MLPSRKEAGGVHPPRLQSTFIAIVRDLSSEGNGVVEHPCGQTFFVPGVWPGEAGVFKVTGLKGRYGFAELVQLDQPSPERVTAACAHHGLAAGQCGGCPWQFMEYPAQLAAKQQRLEKLLQPLMGDVEKLKPIWPSPEIYGYRNRAQFKTDGKKLGYVSANSRTLAPIDDCPILNTHNRQTLQELLASLPRKDFMPKTGRANRQSHRNSNRNQHRHQHRHQSKQAPWLTLEIDDAITAADVSPSLKRSFRQGNSAQNLRMQQWLGNHLRAQLENSQGEVSAVELFCGSGNFTRVIAEAGLQSILAVEGVEPAIVELKNRLADIDSRTKVTTKVANLFVPEIVAEIFNQSQAECLVLDPPRDGFKGLAGLFPAAEYLKSVFYISCNPATFARDAELFAERGFVLREVQPLDQFPHTPHIELLAYLSRS